MLTGEVSGSVCRFRFAPEPSLQAFFLSYSTKRIARRDGDAGARRLARDFAAEFFAAQNWSFRFHS